MSPRAFLLAVSLCFVVLTTRTAFAWVELHTTSHEVRVEVSRSGRGKIEHNLRLKVGGGPLRFLDLRIADRNVTLSEETSLVSAREGTTVKLPVPVTVEQRPDGDLRVEIDGRKGVMRGIYDLRIVYEVDLLRQESLSRDGSMIRLTWAGPKFDDGIDNVKCTFALPAAPTEPRLALDTKANSSPDPLAPEPGSFITTLTRLGQTDELSLLRAHVSKNESVAWAVRVDPRAFGELNHPSLQATAPAVVSSTATAERRAIEIGIGVLIAIAYATILSLKHKQVRGAASDVGAEPRALVPVGIAVRATLAGSLLAASIAAQIFYPDPRVGSAGIMVVVLLTTYLAPRYRTPVKGPGRWLPWSETDAFKVAKSSVVGWLDASTVAGKIVMAAAVVGLGVGVWFVRKTSPYHATLAAADVVVLMALFGTGTRRSMPPDPVKSAASMLRKIASSLRAGKRQLQMRVRVLARVPVGANQPDEIRLSVQPKRSLPGATSIEVGVGWFQGMMGPIALPQVIVRVVDGSDAHQALTAKLAQARWMRGRDAHERAVVLTPRLPTAAMVSSLVDRIQTLLREASVEQAKAHVRAASRARSSQSARSVGRAASASKPATGPSPFQLRRQACKA